MSEADRAANEKLTADAGAYNTQNQSNVIVHCNPSCFSNLTMFRRIHLRAGSARFYLRNTPSMIVNSIPQSTVVQMAAFQFGDRPVWVESGRLRHVPELFVIVHCTGKRREGRIVKGVGASQGGPV